jgi:hypothetical protein
MTETSNIQRVFISLPAYLLLLQFIFVLRCNGSRTGSDTETDDIEENTASDLDDNTDPPDTETPPADDDSDPLDVEVIEGCYDDFHQITDEASYLEILPYECINGGLEVFTNLMEEFRLPHLKRIDGSLRIGDTTTARTIPSFDVLGTVTGSLVIFGHRSVENLDGLSSLRKGHGNF